MICEKIIGTADEPRFADLLHEKVEVEWYNVGSRLNRCRTETGEEVGIRLSGDDLKRGMRHGDVIFADEHRCLVVYVPPCPVIKATVERDHRLALIRLCYEIGNTHAKLICEDDLQTFYVAYTPLYQGLAESLKRIEGIQVEIVDRRLDLADALPASAFAY
ncbi:MAG: hypothetical protein ACOYCB_04720 [Fastidiosipilaceae bacterium]|jgi:urease accessory protein|nr:hypothetical protein [Clostridiaceae bacterium]